MIRLCVSIINYRTAGMTLQCLASVLDDLGDIDGHVVITDNRSDDGSVERIGDWLAAHPGAPVTLVQSVSNSGFSGGHNQGMAAVEAECYLILNSDALLRPGFCRSILAAAEANPEAGLFAPCIESADSTPQDSCFRFPGVASEFVRGVNSGPFTRAFKRRNVSLGTDPDPREIEWASFACILMRRRMVQALGPMDEGYFLYFEDVEYCLRARRSGWGLEHVPDARAVHFRGGSGPVKTLANARKRLPEYYYRSRTRFFRQSHGRAGPILANLAWHTGRGLAQLRRLVGKPVYPVREAEYRDVWIGALRSLEGGRP